jgi:hypothetical protein
LELFVLLFAIIQVLLPPTFFYFSILNSESISSFSPNARLIIPYSCDLRDLSITKLVAKDSGIIKRAFGEKLEILSELSIEK